MSQAIAERVQIVDDKKQFKYSMLGMRLACRQVVNTEVERATSEHGSSGNQLLYSNGRRRISFF